MVSKEEGNSNKSISGGKHLYLNSRTRTFYFRRCKRPRATDLESLPDELLSSILVRLPADYLHHIARLVCRRWSHIIGSDAFVNNQIQHSTYGLLFSCYTMEGSYHPIFVTLTQGGRVETSEFSYKCRSKTSCNGLVMREKSILFQPNTIYIANPATKQSFIPPLIEFNRVCGRFSGIAFAAPSNKYKVTVPCLMSLEKLRLAILTFGVDDSWRNVGIEHLPTRCCDIALYGTPLITEGFMHWTNDEDSVVTLNVETEKLTMFEVPLFFKSPKQLLYLSTGRFLIALVGNGDLSWEVWGMKSETGEWKKVLPDIVLGGQKRKLQQLDSGGGKGKLVPIGWVNYPKVLTLVYYYCKSCTCLFYNLDTQEISSIPLPYPSQLLKAFVHKNTLLHLT
ncbi:hypothetical protein OROHE_016078 [Orobanche hederae]